MSKFLTDLSTAALARAVTENLYALSPFFHETEGVEIYNGEDVKWVVTNLDMPPCNIAFHTNLKPEDADSAIEKFIAKGLEKDVPLQWCITPETRPSDFTARLSAHGFTDRGDGAGMAINLQAMNESEPLPAGLEIVEAKDDKTLKVWCHIVSENFGIPPHVESTLLKVYQNEIKNKQPENFFLGLLDGKPVSTSMYFLDEGVVGIYFVATMPEARNKGIGFAVTQRALQAGRALGYRVGILQASKMGQPVYARMGFKEVCRVQSYQWFPERYNKEQGR
ncbi:MAG: GNAT family N-acetyltransferase [Dehalococcoidales bacterium]